MGSSSSSISGSESSSRQRAPRRRSPPDRCSPCVSQGGRRRASAAMSSLRSRSQAPIASIWVCSSPCSSISAVISSSPSSSPKRRLTSLNRSSSLLASPRPSSTLPRTSLSVSSSGSCGRYPILRFFCGIASPSMSLSSPAMIRSRVDLPAPFRPSTPILAPGKNDSEMSLRMCFFGATTLPTPSML